MSPSDSKSLQKKTWRRTLMNAKKVITMFVLSTFLSLYTTFVLQNFWNWFVVNALNVAHVSYWVTYGLVMIVNLIFYKNDFENEQRWKWLETVLIPCIPEEKRSEIGEELKLHKEDLAVQLGIMIFSTAFGNTVTLALGWAVHTFLV
jgi:hypothetical protein